jgi:hypothetical protein
MPFRACMEAGNPNRNHGIRAARVNGVVLEVVLVEHLVDEAGLMPTESSASSATWATALAVPIRCSGSPAIGKSKPLRIL